MDRTLIQSWLQLPPGDWPPDHYTLLGLESTEHDVARIEQHVHERMERLRHYQLTHPELATEAMNRLAQALVCLTDPAARAAYDRARSAAPADALPPVTPTPPPASAPAPPPLIVDVAPPPAAEPVGEAVQLSDWQTAPPPLRQLVGMAPAAEAASLETVENLVLPNGASLDTLPEAAALPAESAPARTGDELLGDLPRKGLRSKGALYYHIARTRQLLWAWEQVGKYLSRPTRLVSRPAEATDLIHHMTVIRELLPCSTPPMGQAGQPGYLVLALARQQLIVPMLQTLLPSQREALARDWQAGRALLRGLRQLLRHELHGLRRRRGWRHIVRLVGAGIHDHPGLVLLVVAWITLNLTTHELRIHLAEQLLVLLAAVAIRLAVWRYAMQPIRVVRIPRPERRLPAPRKRPRVRRQPNSFRA